MKLPEEIEIFGKIYSLTLVEQALSPDDENADGTIDFENNTIEITDRKDSSDILHSILHEVFHGVINRIGANQAKLSDDVEEILVDSFATFLVETFTIKFKKELL